MPSSPLSSCYSADSADHNRNDNPGDVNDSVLNDVSHGVDLAQMFLLRTWNNNLLPCELTSETLQFVFQFKTIPINAKSTHATGRPNLALKWHSNTNVDNKYPYSKIKASVQHKTTDYMKDITYFWECRERTFREIWCYSCQHSTFALCSMSHKICSHLTWRPQPCFLNRTAGRYSGKQQ